MEVNAILIIGPDGFEKYTLRIASLNGLRVSHTKEDIFVKRQRRIFVGGRDSPCNRLNISFTMVKHRTVKLKRSCAVETWHL